MDTFETVNDKAVAVVCLKSEEKTAKAILEEQSAIQISDLFKNGVIKNIENRSLPYESKSYNGKPYIGRSVSIQFEDGSCISMTAECHNLV
jgi:hypothetical protein